MLRSRLACPFALLFLLLLPFPQRASGSPPTPPSARPELLARFGPAWRLEATAPDGPRRLFGGARHVADEESLRFSTPERAAVLLAEPVAAALAELAPLLGLGAAELTIADGSPVRSGDGRLFTLHHDVTVGGVAVEGARVTVAVSRGRIVLVHAVGDVPSAPPAPPRLHAGQASRAAWKAMGLHARQVVGGRPTRLLLRRDGADWRLAWRVEAIDRAERRRRVGWVDDATGRVLEVGDETVEACDPPVAGGTERRVLGGVRPESALEDERAELLPGIDVAGVTSGTDGFFAAPSPPYAGTLDGTDVRVRCLGCTDPDSPLAPGGPEGDVDFGSGGDGAVGNGRATPADRACAFHLESVRRQARRWLDLAWLHEPVDVYTNVAGDCNAYWNGESLNFKRGSARCSNAGEIRDIIAHEHGHALDGNDGLPPPSLTVDGATGEAVADIVAMLRSRDACIGESFFLDATDWPSDACSGVRDLDETAPGNRRGTLSTGSVATTCPSSGFYRGPLGREGHCEGEILGQAFWHLVRNLATGLSHADGSPIPGGTALGEEAAWQVAEALFYRSRSLLASYAPSSLQSIGVSAYDAFLAADDEGDGLADGTPHAWAIHEAFAHHGIAEDATAPPTSEPCTAPPAPVVSALTVPDPVSGLPAVRLSWDDVGAGRYHVLRADAAGDGALPLGAPAPAGTTAWLDRGILPGRPYEYVVVAEGDAGCLAPPSAPVLGSAGAFLAVADVRVDDSVLGDGDGLLSPGEEADLLVDLANLGSSSATDLSARLDVVAPGLVVVDPGPVLHGTVDPGSTAVAPAAFRVRAEVPAPTTVEVTITAEALEGCLRADHLLEIVQPDLVVVDRVVDDSTGSADGVWDPGETVDLLVTLRNDGSLGADPVTGRLAFRGAPPPGVSLVRDADAWGAVAVRASVATGAPSFALAADPSVEPRTPVPLSLEISVAGELLRTVDVDLEVGGFPPGLVEWNTRTVDIEPLGTGQGVNLPIVVQTDDDDGDGAITECDVPDVIVEQQVIGGTDEILVLSGDDGRLLRSIPVTACRTRWDIFQALAAADVDGDGEPELLTDDLGGHACAMNLDGSLQWITSVRAWYQTTDPFPSHAAPQVWDLDRDGLPEVLIGRAVMDGATGAVRSFDTSPRGSGRALVGDLDLDGWLEIIGNDGHVRLSDGSLVEDVFPDFWSHGGLVNVDGDDHPEVIYVAWADRNTRWVQAREHDGTALWRWDPEPDHDMRCAPCFGDLDGDGLAESVFPGGHELVALDDDGTVTWRLPVDDASGAAGCSVFDFDADGRVEVLHRDENDLRVIDGTGRILWQTPFPSITQGEFPIVADLDRDGSAEIFVYDFQGGNVSNLRAYGNPRWAPARGIWNQEAYSVGHVHGDGTVVTDPVPRWLGANDFRGQQVGCACGGPRLSVSESQRPCGSSTSCFESSVEGGFGEQVVSWDFGDGSDGALGESTCHSFPGPGRYLVVARVRDQASCEGETALAVEVPTDPAVELVGAPPKCPGELACFTAILDGGSEPVELAWSFDGELDAATGEMACHEFEGPDGFSVTVFARDASGCLAESSVDGTFDAPPSSVGPVLLGTAHGDPLAPLAEGTFEWPGDAAAPRPDGQSYLVVRGLDPELLARVPGTEGWTETVHVDVTPAALTLPQVTFLRVLAEDACGRISPD